MVTVSRHGAVVVNPHEWLISCVVGLSRIIDLQGGMSQSSLLVNSEVPHADWPLTYNWLFWCDVRNLHNRCKGKFVVKALMAGDGTQFGKVLERLGRETCLKNNRFCFVSADVS